MPLAKLCITLALALGGWHTALGAALCASHPDCRADALPRAPGHARTASRETQNHPHAADDHNQNAPPAGVGLANHHGHCGATAESPRATTDHAAPPDAQTGAAHGDDEDASSEFVADPRAPASPCEHCVSGQTDQPARVNSVAPGFARDTHAASAPTPRLDTLPQPVPRPRLAPTGHAPPRGRPLHLLNSALLI